MTRLLGGRLGTFKGADGSSVEVDGTLENSPAVLFDGVIVPDGKEALMFDDGTERRENLLAAVRWDFLLRIVISIASIDCT